MKWLHRSAKALLVFVVLLMASTAVAGGRGSRSGGRSGGDVYVRPYVRSNGTEGQGHYRSSPDGKFNNNWSTVGNVNPYTGEPGTKTYPSSTGGGYYPSTTYVVPVAPAPSYVAPNPVRLAHIAPPPILTPPATPDQLAPPRLALARRQVSGASNYLAAEKVKDIQRAAYWKMQGYNFSLDQMNAYLMDEKVKDIQRAAYWETQGYNFSPDRMNAYLMDEKVKDMQRGGR